MAKFSSRYRFPWRPLLLVLMVGALAAADEDGCGDDTSTSVNRDGIEEEAGTAVIWAKPFWAKVVWEKTSPCPPGTFAFDDLCGKCPVAYTWMGSIGLEPDFCYQCEPGFTFGRFPDDDFCWSCPAGTSPQTFGEGFTCR